MGRSAPDYALARALAVIGTWSYSIYLTHMYVAPRILALPGEWGRTITPLEAALVLLASIAAAVAFGFLFHRVVERPLARYSRGIVYRGAERTDAGHNPAPAGRP
jgi:peptidoglycan/LPS O-acetylase OafA/YrhL